MATLRNIFDAYLFLLASCSSPVEQIHDKVSEYNNNIPIISIVADSLELFDDSLGIYPQICTAFRSNFSSLKGG